MCDVRRGSIGGGAVLHGLPHAVADGVKELLDVVAARTRRDVGHVVRLGPRLCGRVVDGGRGRVVALVADEEERDLAVPAVALCLCNPLFADIKSFLWVRGGEKICDDWCGFDEGNAGRRTGLVREKTRTQPLRLL